MRVVILLTAASLASLQAQPDTYVGADACAKCHAAEFRRQSASQHARALYPAARHPLASQFRPTIPLHRSPAYEFRFILESRGLLLRVADAGQAIVLPVEWAFGAGDQAVTFVSRAGPSQYLEFYFSYFSSPGAMGITPGQEAIEVRTVTDAAGFVHRDLDAVQCFQCHSTGPVDISSGAFRPHETGVRCEACHGPGGDHQRSAGKVGIRNPRQLSAAALNDLCGKCHRLPPASGSSFDWSNPWNVRFEPAYLSQSACFRKSKDRLNCLTCHEPHDALRRNDPQFYNHVCTSCHSSSHRDAAMTACTACHMPQVSPRAPLAFTNHWIGIYKSGRITPQVQ